MILEKLYLSHLLIMVSFSLISQNEVEKTNNYEMINSEQTTVWKFKTNGAVYASPVLHKGIVYMGSSDSTFYAIDAKSGTALWTYKLNNQILSDAVIEKDNIYLQAGNSLIVLSISGKFKKNIKFSNDSVIERIDPWDFHFPSPLIHNGVIYLSTQSGSILGFELKQYKQVFNCQTANKEIIRTPPTIYKNKLFFADWDGIAYAFDLRTGKKNWEFDTKKDGTFGWRNSIQATLLVFKDNIYFGGRSCRFYSVNAENGAKNWFHKSPTDQWLIGKPLISNGLVLFGSSDQKLFNAIDIKTGQIKWQTKVDCRTWGKPTINDGKVYIGSNSLYEIELTTGKILRQFTFKKVHKDKKYGKYIDRTANIHSSPVIYENKVIFGSDDSFIYAIKLD